MDDELRELERRARERGDAASALAWAAALRRAGRDAEAASAAFEARARGASRDEVFPVAQPREGGGEPIAPWPHPRGDAAGTRRSRVEGPTERARLLFEIDLGEEDAAWGHGPIVLPDGSVVVALDRTEHGGSYLKCFASDGTPRWSTGLRENISAPVALAGGEVVVTTAREAIFIVAGTGKEASRTPLVARAAFGEVVTRFLPAPWNRSVVIAERVVGGDGALQELRGAGGRRLKGRSAIVGPDGSVYVPAKVYTLETTTMTQGVPPPLVLGPMALHAFGREGQHRWTVPLDLDDAQVAAGRDRILVRGRAGLVVLDRASGRVLEERPFGGPWLALDGRDEPIAVAPFGPPLIAAPVVDAAGRRYAAVERGDLVGLAPDSSPLFAAKLDLTRERLTGGLALAPGRLYAIVLRTGRRSVICVGDA